VPALAGCGETRQRIPIEGTVTYQGKPLAHGTISFVPKDAGTGTLEGALVTDGKYAFAPKTGLFPGAYHVSVSAPDFTGPAPAPGAAPGRPRRARELLPERYNKKSTLTIEVSPTGKREFDFTLE
jgi:hypothetical protein